MIASQATVITHAQYTTIKKRFAQPTKAMTPLGNVVTTSALADRSPPACVYVAIITAKAIPISRMLTHVRFAVHNNEFLAIDHGSVRTSVMLINIAAIAKLGIPIIADKLCSL